MVVKRVKPITRQLKNEIISPILPAHTSTLCVALNSAGTSSGFLKGKAGRVKEK
jgi:hypothetical protein